MNNCKKCEHKGIKIELVGHIGIKFKFLIKNN